ncbi:MAG: glycosyl hydrolase 108 family protein [Cyanobacteriota bacterium]|nr:glycosyl hydrolase 108 family protein [Cyanobacteriota bacterium]
MKPSDMEPLSPPINFFKALEFTLRWEGGWSDHPDDLGGQTMKGVIQSVYDRYRTSKELPQQSVAQLTDDELMDIYYNLYWKPAYCDDMKYPLALCMFDTAVNFGHDNALLFLEEILALDVGTKFEPSMLETEDPKAIAMAVCGARIFYRYQRVRENDTQKAFLRGWLNRDRDLLDRLSRML